MGERQEGRFYSDWLLLVGYVLEGGLTMKLDGQPERLVRAGESFCETPHSVPVPPKR